MPCNNTSPCHEPTCNECNTVNPCYDNCGCLNPTTFECITNIKQSYSQIPFYINQTGHDFLLNLNSTIETIKNSLYKVRADDSDSCPDSLYDKIEAGNENITLEVTGSGCNRKLVISAGEGIGSAGIDRYVKISANDTTSDYLTNKISDGTYVKKTVLNPGLDEEIRFDITLADLISTDSGNQLTQGVDGKLKTSFIAPDGSETKISVAANQGLTLQGNGTVGTPYIIGTNGAIFAIQPFCDGVWKPLIFTNGSNSDVTVNSQSAQYRLRFDGTIEFRGVINYTVNFTTSNKITITANNFATGGSNMFPSSVFTRAVNLKSFTTFSAPNTINITPKLTGYNINTLVPGSSPTSPVPIVIEFLNDTSGPKNIVVTLDGCQYHPNF